ncbi:MAG: GNAT family N-acetyltransferase [bacterium]
MPREALIRPVAVAELGEIMHRIIAVRAAAYEPWNGPRSPEQRRDEAARWLEKIADRVRPAIFVAVDGDCVVGYVWGYEEDPRCFSISHIGVLPERGRRGIGRALLKQCESLSRDRGYEVVSTSTYDHFSGMRDLLLQEGYAISGITKEESAGHQNARLELTKPL